MLDLVMAMVSESDKSLQGELAIIKEIDRPSYVNLAAVIESEKN